MTDPLATLNYKDAVFPGGSLLEGYFHRDVVRLSDRGGASGMIGDRWSDVVADFAEGLPGSTISSAAGDPLVVERVIRLDDHPGISALASKRKLQNPDFLILGSVDDRPAIMSMDAKFSIETAKSSQVSAEALDALLNAGPRMTALLGVDPHQAVAYDGVFVCPDAPLTHYMLTRRKGFRSASVTAEEALPISVTPVGYLKPLEGAPLIPTFASIDGYEPETRRNLLLATYEFRLIRAAVGCWLDERLPLLGRKSDASVDMADIAERSERFARGAASAWDVVLAWDAAAATSRSRREQVLRVTAPPVTSKQLRMELDAHAVEGSDQRPSLNQVRRRVGAWFHGEIVEEVGHLDHDIVDFPGALARLETVVARVTKRLEHEQPRLVKEVVDETKARSADEDAETE